MFETLANFLGDEDEKPNKFTLGMGELIRKAREEKSLSQGELAKQVYRRRATITDIENGKHEINASTLALISAALDKPITYFYPKYLYRHIPAEELSTSEQELVMYFRRLQLDELEEVAINLLRVLTEFDPYETLKRIVPIAKDYEDMYKGLDDKFNRK